MAALARAAGRNRAAAPCLRLPVCLGSVGLPRLGCFLEILRLSAAAGVAAGGVARADVAAGMAPSPRP